MPHSIAEELWHIVFWQDHFFRCARRESLAYPQHAKLGWKRLNSLSDSRWQELVARFESGLTNAAYIAGHDRSERHLYSSISKHLGQHPYFPSDPRPTARDNRASGHTSKKRSDCAGRRCRTARYLTVRQTLAIYCDCWRERRESPSCRRQRCRCAVAVATNGLELKNLGRVEFCWIRANCDRDQVTAIATLETSHHKDEKCCQRSTRKVFHGAPPEVSAQRSGRD